MAGMATANRASVSAGSPLRGALARCRHLPLLPDELMRLAMDEFGMSRGEAQRLVMGLINSKRPVPGTWS